MSCPSWLQRKVLTSAALLACLHLALCLACPGVLHAEARTGFLNGTLHEYPEWLDNRSELINAHDGGVIFVDGTYYWYGMALRPLGAEDELNDGAATTTGILLYSSRDLLNWTYEKVILPTSDDPASPLCGPMRFERPKILFNPRTRKFVLWFHYVKRPGKHGDTLGMAEAGVAVADKITDTFTFQGHHRPIDESCAVKDCTLFQDTDGAAYFIYDRKVSGKSRCLHVVRLSDDYLHSTNVWAKIEAAASREAPAMVKRNGIYYLFTSGVTGWRPNAARYYTATHILGPYTDQGDPCTGPDSSITYNAQSTQIFKVENLADAYILMLERHNTRLFTRCSYVWLPLRFPAEGKLRVGYQPKWGLDQFTQP